MVIIVNIRTPEFYKGGLTLKFKHVLKNYWRRGLLIDIIAALPINLVLGGIL
jgi:hypothetical protein